MMYKKGFTLIETVIYIALFTILMGGALITSYNLIEGSESAQVKATIQEEGNFVLRKLNWALSGLSSVNTPTFGYSENLGVTKIGPVQIDVRLEAGNIEIREGSGPYVPITTANVEVSTLQFHFLPGGAGPDGIEASTTISGVTFYTKKYLRQ